MVEDGRVVGKFMKPFIKWCVCVDIWESLKHRISRYMLEDWTYRV